MASARNRYCVPQTTVNLSRSPNWYCGDVDIAGTGFEKFGPSEYEFKFGAENLFSALKESYFRRTLSLNLRFYFE